MKSLGRHVIAELYNCDARDLNDPNFVVDAAIRASRASHGKILGKMVHEYAPYGISVVIFLAESHLFVHTWPEYGYAAADIFTCGRNTIPMIGIKEFIKSFKPTSYSVSSKLRGSVDKVGNIRSVPNKRDEERTIHKD